MGRLEIGVRKLDEDWEIVEEKMKRTIEEIERERGKEKEKKREWWDEECETKKSEVRRELRKWRRKGEMERGTKEVNMSTKSYVRKERGRRI